MRSRARSLRLLRARDVDGAGELAVVDDHEHLVEEHLRVADAGGDVVPLVGDGADARLADGEQRHQRLVPRQDAELAVDAGEHHHGDLARRTPAPSGVTTSTWSVRSSLTWRLSRFVAGELLGLLGRLLDAADHEEGLLRAARRTCPRRGP